MQIYHNGAIPNFKLKATGSFKGAMRRQVNEAVRIKLTYTDVLFNSKAEFRQAPIVRVVATRGLQNEHNIGDRLVVPANPHNNPSGPRDSTQPVRRGVMGGGGGGDWNVKINPVSRF